MTATPPPPLTPAERRTAAGLWRVAHALAAHPAELTHRETALMLWLASQPDWQVDTATLAEGLPSVVSRNGLTRAMGGLVAAGLLRRHAGLVPGDRRRVLVSLTLRGKLLARRLVDLMQDGEEV